MIPISPLICRFQTFVLPLFIGLLLLPDGFSREKEKKIREKSAVEKKAGEIVIPQVEFVETPVWDSVDFLVQRSRELDADEADSSKRGVNVVLIGDYRESLISMRLTQVPLDATLQVLADILDADLEARSEVLLINRDCSYDVVARQGGGDALESKLKQIVLPSVEFQDTPVRDAVEFLQQRSVELDTGNGGARQGVNLVLKNGESPGEVSFRLKNVSLYSALEVLAMATGAQMEIREHLVYFRPRQQQGRGRQPRTLPPQEAAPEQGSIR